MQILEGDKTSVTETYQRVARDPRHTTASIMNVRDVQDRAFPNWTTGGVIRTPEMQEVYLQHGIGGAIGPSRLKSTQVLDLVLGLQGFERAKRQVQSLAS